MLEICVRAHTCIHTRLYRIGLSGIHGGKTAGELTLPSGVVMIKQALWSTTFDFPRTRLNPVFAGCDIESYHQRLLQSTSIR